MTSKRVLAINFIKLKMADVKLVISARRQAYECFKSGTDAHWEFAASLHPSTKGKAMLKKQRSEAAKMESRIIKKYELQLAMFENVLSELSL